MPAEHVERIGFILDALEAAATPTDMDLPGLRLHKLTGDMLGRCAVTVRANWRITFGWDEKDAIEVDYVDYH